jgi:CRP-like cAMP-binding protein
MDEETVACRVPCHADIEQCSDHCKADSSRADSQTYPAGFELMRQGESVRSVHWISKGIAKLEHSDSDGSTVIVGLRESGSYLGACETLLGMPALATAFTLVPTTTLRFRPRDFLDLVDKDHSFLLQVCLALSRDAHYQVIRSIELGGVSACRRLEHFLMALAAHEGGNDSDPPSVPMIVRHLPPGKLM